MSLNPTGPLTPQQLRALADAPHGEALKQIRKFDPLYGKLSNDGVPVKWRVKLSKEVIAIGYVTVEAVTAEDAEQIAHDTPDHKVDWDFDDDGCAFWVDEVKPA